MFFGPADPHVNEDPYVAGIAYTNACRDANDDGRYYLESVFNDMGTNSGAPGFAQLNTPGRSV